MKTAVSVLRCGSTSCQGDTTVENLADGQCSVNTSGLGMKWKNHRIVCLQVKNLLSEETTRIIEL